jgi:hypothetical protein
MKKNSLCVGLCQGQRLEVRGQKSKVKGRVAKKHTHTKNIA